VGIPINSQEQMFCSGEISSFKSPLAEIILVNVVEIFDLLLYYGDAYETDCNKQLGLYVKRVFKCNNQQSITLLERLEFIKCHARIAGAT